MIAFSAKLKDKRVDKILEKSGQNMAECTVFYSPIVGFWAYFAIFIAVLIPFSLKIAGLILQYPRYVVLYLIVQYLALAYLNNSFVLTPKNLLVINPNFPFQHCTTYALDQVEKVTIDRSGFRWFSWILLIFTSHFTAISSRGATRRFYCMLLERDAFDENITEKNLDDFQAALTQQGVVLDFKLKN